MKGLVKLTVPYAMHFTSMPFITDRNAVQKGMANNLIYTSEIHLYPLNREGVKKNYDQR
jgi:hypothetical protein